MPLTRTQFDALRAKGLTVEQIIRFEKGETPKQSFLQETAEDIKQTGTALKNTLTDTMNRVGQATAAEKAGEQGMARTALQKTGAVAKGLSGAVGDVVTGAVKTVLPKSAEQGIKNTLQSSLQAITPIAKKIDEASGSPVGTWLEKYKALDPKTKRDVDALFGIGNLALDIATAGAGKKAVSAGAGKKAVSAGVDVAVKGAEKTSQVLKSGVTNTAAAIEKLKTPLKAAGQASVELSERVPRAIGRVKESANEAVARSARIKAATPEVANAIKSKLDDRFINTIAEADDSTRRAFKQVVDIAEETPKTVGLKKQPSIVSGELASKQYDLINKQKKSVGAELGEKVKQLSKTERVNMEEGFRELDDVLGSQGIYIRYTKKGPKLDFSGTKYTPAERTKIQELYKLSSEGGYSLSPSSIRAKDQLFSKLQREAAMEGVGRIIIETADGNKSLFNIFRDVFSKNLEAVSPEIKKLNKKYRDLALITEDIEDSILRTPNFNITKTADPAEFAKVNLRRIFGEAQSSPVFEAIADQMDSVARQLGYREASPKQVAEFTQELRKLYPESVPKTGFAGGVSSGVSGAIGSLVEATLKAGTPNITDQRKALRSLIESYLKKTSPKLK